MQDQRNANLRSKSSGTMKTLRSNVLMKGCKTLETNVNVDVFYAPFCYAYLRRPDLHLQLTSFSFKFKV